MKNIKKLLKKILKEDKNMYQIMVLLYQLNLLNKDFIDKSQIYYNKIQNKLNKK